MRRRPQTDRYSPGSTFIVRIAGLPIESLYPLRFEQTTQLIEKLLAQEEALSSQAQALSEDLYQIIGKIEDKQVKWRLMAVRRTIYQLQIPKARDLNEQVMAEIPRELAETLLVWIEQAKQRLELLSTGQTVLEAEWAEKRRVLQRVAQAKNFQHGLIMGSKDLYLNFVKWSQADGQGRLHSDRQTELGLFIYLSRMATKTSPFSTFMSSGRGHWVDDEPSYLLSAHWQQASVIELNWSLVHRIAYELANWPEIRPHLAIKVNSSCVEEEGSLKFLGWKKGETVLKLANSATLQHMLRIIRTAQHASYELIVQTIVQLDSDGREDEIRAFLERLIKIGLLEFDLGIPDQSPDYFGQLLTFLKRFRGPRLEEIFPLLQKIQNCLLQYAATENSAERCDLRITIHSALEQVYEYLTLKQRGLAIPTKNAFYENTLAQELSLRCSRSTWQETLDDLSLIQQLSALYDEFLPARLAAAAFFVDAYGENKKVGLLQFYERFRQEMQRPGGWRSDNVISSSPLKTLFETPYGTPSLHLAELERVKQLCADFQQMFLEQSAAASQECHLDRAELQRFVATFPAFVTSPHSLSFYVQKLARGDGPRLVLNGATGGFGRSEARLRFLEMQECHADTSYQLQEEKRQEEPLLVDISGVFGFSANLHACQTAYEIAYPGTVSVRPEEERLPLSDLEVVHDPQHHCLKLFSRRLQREVLPVHLGLLADFLLPPLCHFLLHLFSESVTNSFSWLRIPDIAQLGPDFPLQRYPRVCMGTLVLDRATWLVGVEHIPKREKGTSPFTYMLEVQRWQAAHQLPQECFARVLILRANASPEESGFSVIKDRKPLYIDFRNYLSIMMFEQIVDHAQRMDHPAHRVLFLQEVLPSQEDLVLSAEEGTYVSEFVIELSRKGAIDDDKATVAERTSLLS